APIDDEKLAVFCSDGVGGALTAIQQGDFPEDLARPNQIEHGILAFARRHRDLHLPGAHRIKAGSLITLGKDRGSALDSLGRGMRAQLIDDARAERSKQRVILQNAPLIEYRTYRLMVWACGHLFP